MAIEQNFPSNSDKSKRAATQQQAPEKKDIQPVVTGGVKKSEKKHSFLADDFKDVKSYLLTDVMLPAAKSLVYDTISKGVSMMLWGEDRSGRKNTGSRFNYSSISTRDSRDDRPVTKLRTRTEYNYEDLIFETRNDAEKVLEQMCDIYDRCGYVSAGDMYDLAGFQTISTDFDWGWTNLSEARVRGTRDGYFIEMPRLENVSRR